MKLRLSIKLRLLATLVLLGVLLVITGVVGLVGIQTSNEAVKQAYSNDVAAAISLGNSILNLTITRTMLDRALLHPEAPDAAALDKFRSEQGKSRYAAAQDRYTFLLTATAVAISLGLLACVACGFNLFRAISRPLGLTLRHFEKIASGDMTDKLHLKSGDEME